MRARILIGEMPRMMHDIVDDAVEAQADMEIVGHCVNSELDAAIPRYGANVIIVAEDATAIHDMPSHLLMKYPDVRLVIVTGDGRRASLFELRHLELDEPSPVTLIDAIRTAMHWDDDTFPPAGE